MLKKAGVKLELLTDYDMHLTFEQDLSWPQALIYWIFSTFSYSPLTERSVV